MTQKVMIGIPDMAVNLKKARAFCFGGSPPHDLFRKLPIAIESPRITISENYFCVTMIII